VSQCRFISCSAASGGAMSVSGAPGGGLYLSVHDSNFTANFAIGGLACCPADARQPCSTWGGAVAVFDMLNVTFSGCKMVNNTAQAVVPASAHQYYRIFGIPSGNAVAGGGCVSVIFSGNVSGPSVLVTDSTFHQCTVTLSIKNGVSYGNGMPGVCIAERATLMCMIDVCAGYGGGLSVYFGLSTGLQLLDVTSFSLALRRNHFTRCTVIQSAGRDEIHGGNAYGGGVSVYMGGYSSSIYENSVAVAAVGDTTVQNSSVRVETVSFTSCSATTGVSEAISQNSYGGSFSLYLGGYAWSQSFSSSSSSTSGLTSASGVSVFISNVNSSDCSATTTGSSGGNSYGGSFSLYLGGYAWSFGRGEVRSTSGLTSASGVSVFISNVNSSDCSATTTGVRGDTFGGAMSVAYIGAYAWSYALTSTTSTSSSSACGTTNVTGLVVSISSSMFANSFAASRTFHIFCVLSCP
jgi:hypothetical protein